jgi:hypothetical protein
MYSSNFPPSQALRAEETGYVDSDLRCGGGGGRRGEDGVECSGQRPALGSIFSKTGDISGSGWKRVG